jgi:hypothetical protein
MNVLCRLALAIDYPLPIPADAVEFTFKVDDGEIRALDLQKRLVLLREVTRKEDDLPRLATYAVGRVFREDAVLYWDEHSKSVMLSKEITSSATSHELKLFFETFVDSCDWWLARMESKPVDSTSFPEMVIRP